MSHKVERYSYQKPVDLHDSRDEEIEESIWLAQAS